MNKVFVLSGERDSVIPPIAGSATAILSAAGGIVFNHTFLGSVWSLDWLMLILAVVPSAILMWRFASQTPLHLITTTLEIEHVGPALRSYLKHIEDAERRAREPMPPTSMPLNQGLPAGRIVSAPPIPRAATQAAQVAPTQAPAAPQQVASVQPESPTYRSAPPAQTPPVQQAAPPIQASSSLVGAIAREQRVINA